jgi:hypothetical protein
MRGILATVVLTGLLLSGCTGSRPDYSLFPSEHEQRTNELWRQGYGYENPNIERIKNDQQPLNFDGDTPFGDLVGRALGNAVAFGIFEVIPGMFRGIWRKLSNRDP